MSNFAERRKESREKHGEELRAAFKVIDKDNSGWASINEMWWAFNIFKILILIKTKFV